MFLCVEVVLRVMSTSSESFIILQFCKENQTAIFLVGSAYKKVKKVLKYHVSLLTMNNFCFSFDNLDL